MTLLPRRAAFVVGVPRSGTTLLARLLDGHPQLFVLPFETHASQWVGRADPVPRLLARMTRAAGLAPGSPGAQQLERSLRERLPGPADLTTLLLAAVACQLELRPTPQRAELWVEKTPRHLRCVPELLRAFGPETRVVALVRDPRAAMASRRERFGRNAGAAVRHFAQRWALADALTHRFRERFAGFLALRYEDLVSDVETAMRRVAEHLAIRWDEALTRPTLSGVDWAGNSSFGSATQSGVSRDSVERWREELRPEEVGLLELLLQGRMRAWRYEPVSGVSQGPALRRFALEAVTLVRLQNYRGA